MAPGPRKSNGSLKPTAQKGKRILDYFTASQVPAPTPSLAPRTPSPPVQIGAMSRFAAPRATIKRPRATDPGPEAQRASTSAVDSAGTIMAAGLPKRPRRSAPIPRPADPVPESPQSSQASSPLRPLRTSRAWTNLPVRDDESDAGEEDWAPSPPAAGGRRSKGLLPVSVRPSDPSSSDAFYYFEDHASMLCTQHPVFGNETPYLHDTLPATGEQQSEGMGMVHGPNPVRMNEIRRMNGLNLTPSQVREEMDWVEAHAKPLPGPRAAALAAIPEVKSRGKSSFGRIQSLAMQADRTPSVASSPPPPTSGPYQSFSPTRPSTFAPPPSPRPAHAPLPSPKEHDDEDETAPETGPMCPTSRPLPPPFPKDQVAHTPRRLFGHKSTSTPRTQRLILSSPSASESKKLSPFGRKTINPRNWVRLKEAPNDSTATSFPTLSSDHDLPAPSADPRCGGSRVRSQVCDARSQLEDNPRVAIPAEEVGSTQPGEDEVDCIAVRSPSVPRQASGRALAAQRQDEAVNPLSPLSLRRWDKPGRPVSLPWIPAWTASSSARARFERADPELLDGLDVDGPDEGDNEAFIETAPLSWENGTDWEQEVHNPCSPTPTHASCERSASSALIAGPNLRQNPSNSPRIDKEKIGPPTLESDAQFLSNIPVRIGPKDPHWDERKLSEFGFTVSEASRSVSVRKRQNLVGQPLRKDAEDFDDEDMYDSNDGGLLLENRFSYAARNASCDQDDQACEASTELLESSRRSSSLLLRKDAPPCTTRASNASPHSSHHAPKPQMPSSIPVNILPHAEPLQEAAPDSRRPAIFSHTHSRPKGRRGSITRGSSAAIERESTRQGLIESMSHAVTDAAGFCAKGGTTETIKNAISSQSRRVLFSSSAPDASQDAFPR